jgi:hypothetical protein
MRPYAILLASLAAACLAGCSSEPAALPVSGTVTLHGQPLDQGFIEFSPLDESGLMSGAQILNGQYSVPAEQGLSAARYQVRITSSEGGAVVGDEPPGESTITAKERIPPEFNINSQQEVEVKDSGENKFDFNIP